MKLANEQNTYLANSQTRVTNNSNHMTTRTSHCCMHATTCQIAYAAINNE